MPAKKLTPQAKKFVDDLKGYIKQKDVPPPKKKYEPSTVLVRKPSKKSYA